VLARKAHECNADWDAQISLRGGADRTQRLDQAEIDHEGRRGREHRVREHRQQRFVDGMMVQGCFDHEADPGSGSPRTQQRTRGRAPLDQGL